MNNRQFKKGEVSREAYDIIMFDLECLELKKTKDNEYHYNLLKGNLKDIFGIKNNKKEE